jgi:hypothetical protein
MKGSARTLAAVLFGLVSINAQAYTYITCSDGTLMDFGGGHMTFNFANNLSATQQAAIALGHSRLTYFSDSSITIANTADSSYSMGNSENEIYLDSSIATAHCAYTYYISTCTVAEADMAYGNQVWLTVDNSDHTPYLHLGRSMTGTAVHEGGHCIGMAHTNTLYNMMGAEFSHVTRNSINAWYGPGEDLSDGLIDLHGKRSTTDAYRDVGVTVMRYLGISGEYSTHKFGQLYDATGTTVLPTDGSYVGQTKYRVTAGDTITMELTIENNGEQFTENPVMNLYLSTNDIISTSDTQLSTETVTAVNRGAPWEVTRTVTIPADTPAGNYFLGAYIDADGAINEQTAANNVAYYPITVEAADDNYEENDTLATAYSIASNELTWLSTIAGDGIQLDEDWYQISVTSGFTNVLVDLQFIDAEGDIDIQLVDSTGAVLQGSYSTTDDESINYIVPAGGIYYLRVYYGNAGNAYDLWWDDIVPPTLTVTKADPYGDQSRYRNRYGDF